MLTPLPDAQCFHSCIIIRGIIKSKIHELDAKIIDFKTLMDNFHYIVTPFGLKMLVKLIEPWHFFHEMLHQYLEDYVGDIVVKFKKVYSYVNDLKKVFVRRKQYRFRKNSLNCALEYLQGNYEDSFSINNELILIRLKLRLPKPWKLLQIVTNWRVS